MGKGQKQFVLYEEVRYKKNGEWERGIVTQLSPLRVKDPELNLEDQNSDTWYQVQKLPKKPNAKKSAVETNNCSVCVANLSFIKDLASVNFLKKHNAAVEACYNCRNPSAQNSCGQGNAFETKSKKSKKNKKKKKKNKKKVIEDEEEEESDSFIRALEDNETDDQDDNDYQQQDERCRLVYVMSMGDDEWMYDDDDISEKKEEKDTFEKGDVVMVRDLEEKDWLQGTVTCANPLYVKPDGWKQAFLWEFVQKIPKIPTFDRVSIQMDPHDIDPWGVTANLSAPYDQWKISGVTEGHQAKYKNVPVGWKIIAWRGERITSANSYRVAQELRQGLPGLVTLENPVPNDYGFESVLDNNTNQQDDNITSSPSSNAWWSCDVCTYKNAPGNTSCSMCHKPKHSSFINPNVCPFSFGDVLIVTEDFMTSNTNSRVLLNVGDEITVKLVDSDGDIWVNKIVEDNDLWDNDEPIVANNFDKLCLAKDMPWNCAECTYENIASDTWCFMCQKPRK